MKTSTIGYPRIGPNREMKKALESFWSKKISQEELLNTSREVDAAAWKTQADAGIDLVALDGTLYDSMLDHVLYLGLEPARFQHLSSLDKYFACARGATNAQALDMSKYFSTNYHYLVPELSGDSTPKPNWSAFLERIRRGQAVIGKEKAVPLLIGPLTFLSISRGKFDLSVMVDRLLPAYVDVLKQLSTLGVPEVQIHEPVFCTDFGGDKLASELQLNAEKVYRTLVSALDNKVPIHLVIPYDDLTEDVYQWVVGLPVQAIGFDFCGTPGSSSGNLMTQLIAKYGFPKEKRLGVGIIDGRSIWKDDGTAVAMVNALRRFLGPDQPMTVQTSTSLQHVPLDVELEKDVPDHVKAKLAFADQKLKELVALHQQVANASTATSTSLDLASYTGGPSASSSKTNSSIPADYFHRPAPYEVRRPQQLQFPPFPTTSIGSFPQTGEIRRARLQFNKGVITEVEYREKMAAEIGFAIGMQEALGVDVLVHGEAERTDMVEYFGRHLKGFYFTERAWVQSYGSRYVRPPIVAEAVSRVSPMTVHEFKLAQSLTKRPVKGMLTGPVTILNWSFSRKDIPRSEQAWQIALALREEVADLEAAGCRILQVDEPALREGLPLRQSRTDEYLEWATKAFRLSTGVASPACQIVTHLCYSQFEEILQAIDALDADVLTIENSRSDDEMVRALVKYGYPRDLGPGVYDVHSPVVPTVDFIAQKARGYLSAGALNGDASRIWINPDCGLKTRRWEEVIPAMRNMVNAAHLLRKETCSKDRPGDASVYADSAMAVETIQ